MGFSFKNNIKIYKTKIEKLKNKHYAQIHICQTSANVLVANRTDIQEDK